MKAATATGLPGATTSSTPLVGFGVVLIAAALFGTLGPLSRAAYAWGMEPLSFVTWRTGVGAVVLILVVAWGATRGRQIVRAGSLDRRARLGLAVAAATGMVLNIGMFAAFDRIAIGLTLLLFYTYPALTAGVAVILGREPLDRPRSIALVLATGGMVLVLAGQLEGGRLVLEPLGIGLGLAAAVSQTIFITVSRDAYAMVPSDQAMALILLGAATGVGAIAIVGGAGPEILLPLARPELLSILAFTGIFAAAIPSLLFLTGIRIIGGTRAAILMLLEPLVGVALAALLLAETLRPIQLAGGVAILGAAVVLQRAAIAGHRLAPGAEPREAA